MLIGPPVPEIQLFKKLTLKIQGQGHGWSQSSKSQCESNILSTHIPLVPCQSVLPFLRYSIFKIWPWKSKVKVIAQSHKVGITPYQLISLSFHVDRPSHSWDTAIPKFDPKNSRSRSWVRSKLKVTTWVHHSVDLQLFRSMSIGHPIPELRLFQNLTLKIQCQGHGWGQSSKVTMWVKHPIDSHPFRFMSIGPLIPEIQHFQNLTLNIQGLGQMTMMLHNYRSRQFHRTSNGINPSIGCRDMGSAKSGPSAAWFDKFLAHGQAHMGQKGK